MMRSPNVGRKGRLAGAVAIGTLCAFIAPCLASGQQNAADASAAAKKAASSDTVLAAMAAELDRSKAKLKMGNLAAPYYIEYHVTDVQQFYVEAAFGGLRISQSTHSRSLRVVVRVGDYKSDSYGPGPGLGVADTAPIEDDQTALRRALWMGTDRAYKAANEALATKQANQTQFSGEQGFDDFSHEQPVQSLGPVVKLTVDPKPWTDMVVKATDLFRTDPKLTSLSASGRFVVTNKYFVNSEGTVTREGGETDTLQLSGATQATDGMRLVRAPYFVAAKQADLPSAEKFEAAMGNMIATLKALRDAPVVEENYDGPVLFAPDASADIVATLIGDNVLGERPRAGDTSRTTGAFASSYKSRVLPTFLSVVDDPTASVFASKSLAGSYHVDDEGVPAQKVPLVDKGILANYLVGRQPIRDFPASNGHARAVSGQAPHPSVSNLIVTASDSLSPDDLKKKLVGMCRDEGKPYCYFAQSLIAEQSIAGGRGRGRGATVNVEMNPVLLYRVYVSDGHEELVRGAVFGDLDTRSLRGDLVAAGNDPIVDNREGGIPEAVVAPSLLFDDLEIRRTDVKNPKMPEYEAPALTGASGH